MEFTGKKSVITPEGVFIIGTYDENGVPNAMNAAWGMQSDMGEITLMLAKHKTTDNFEKTGAFTVAFGTADTILISDYFGVETGNKVNKIEKAGCHVHRSAHVNAPIIEEYPLTLECRVVEFQDQPYGLRVLGEIVNVLADESVLDEKGKIDAGKLNAFMFDQMRNDYYGVGEVIGKAWNAGAGLMKK